jgi:hypothetical protein
MGKKMRSASKILFASVLSLVLAAPAVAQHRVRPQGFQSPPVQTPPFLQQRAALQQLGYARAASAQFGLSGNPFALLQPPPVLPRGGFQTPPVQTPPFLQQQAAMRQLAYAAAVSNQYGLSGAFGGSLFAVGQLAPYYSPALQLQQAALSQFALGQAVSAQYAFGGPVFGTPVTIPGLGSFAALNSVPIGTTYAAGLPSYYGLGSGYPYQGGYTPGSYPQSYYFEDPTGAYYRGTAALITSYGPYFKDYQQMRLMNQEVERSKILTRRQLIEEMRAMQSLRPNPLP